MHGVRHGTVRAVTDLAEGSILATMDIPCPLATHRLRRTAAL